MSDSATEFAAAGDVHIWVAACSDAAAFLPALVATLTTDELSRADRFRFERDQIRFRVARGLLRLLLGRYTGQPARTITLQAAPHGKPYLDEPAPAFNISHSGDLVLLAFCQTGSVGVDIERHRDGIDFAALAKVCFSESERQRILGGEATRTAGRFFDHWARKESWMKADGRGLSLPLAQYSLDPGPDSTESYFVTGPEEECREWSTRSLPVADGYSAAVTMRGRDWQPVIRPALPLLDSGIAHDSPQD